MVGFNFAPVGWALCNGQILPISPYTPLFSLIGTFYGGNGTSNFALPNMQSRVPIHQGQGVGLSTYTIGEIAGTENTTLTVNNLPSHNHLMQVNNTDAPTIDPTGAYLAKTNNGDTRNLQEFPTYALSPTAGKTLATAAITNTGGGLPISILQPFLVVNFIIALAGIFPSRS
jgi:microcystin-dependent protein